MGKFKFFDKNECFIEYEWAFGGDFLETLFKDKYKQKYSMIGDGIYNLVFIDDKIYSIDIKKTTTLLANDGKKAYRDTTKDQVVDAITNKLRENGVNCTVNSGKFITFKHNDFTFKIEVVKKAAIPA